MKTETVEVDIASQKDSRGCFVPVNWQSGANSVCGIEATLWQAFLKVANVWGLGQLDVDSITVSGTAGPMKGKELKLLARAAWCKAFNVLT